MKKDKPFNDGDKIVSKKILLVEGGDDKHFFHQFLTVRMKFPEDQVQVVQAGGVDNYEEALSEIVRAIKALIATSPKSDSPQPIEIAIIRDADKGKERSFKAVNDALSANGFAIPDAINSFSKPKKWEDGITDVRVGVCVIPTAIKGRMLEDLCLATFPPDALQKAKVYLKEEGIEDSNEIFQSKYPKRLMQVFLASRQGVSGASTNKEKKKFWSSLSAAAEDGLWYNTALTPPEGQNDSFKELEDFLKLF